MSKSGNKSDGITNLSYIPSDENLRQPPPYSQGIQMFLSF